MKKLVLMLMAMLVCFVAVGCGGEKQAPPTKQEQQKKFKIVTSFYPMYIDTINLTKGIDGVEVVNMTKPQTGCLHDYQLVTEDLKVLESADAFVINGAGMEQFMDKVIEQQKNLKIIEASKTDKIAFIEEDGEENPHVWVSVSASIEQVKAIAEQLAAADPAHEKEYKANCDAYVKKLEALKKEMHDVIDPLPNRDIVTFHEAFPYFAQEFNLNIVSVIEREPGTEPTPQELEETIEDVKKLSVKALFAEPQYSPAAAETIAKETGAKIYQLDPVVTGESDENAMDAYINTMKKNAEVLKEALK